MLFWAVYSPSLRSGVIANNPINQSRYYCITTNKFKLSRTHEGEVGYIHLEGVPYVVSKRGIHLSDDSSCLYPHGIPNVNHGSCQLLSLLNLPCYCSFASLEYLTKYRWRNQ